MPYDLVATDQDKGINSPVFYSFNSGACHDPCMGTCTSDELSIPCTISDGADYQLFDIEPATGVITIAKEFEEDDLNQPATLVVRVSVTTVLLQQVLVSFGGLTDTFLPFFRLHR